MLFKQILVGLGLLIGLAGLFAGIWYGTRVEALTIDQVTVTGGETIAHEAVKDIANEVLSGTYFKLVPRQFAWLYPETELLSRIYTIERIQSVALERKQATELSIHITEYLPTALWCEEQMTNHCFFIDETGYAFTAAPDLSGGALVRYVTIGWGPKRGAQLLAMDDLAAVTWLYNTLKDELDWVATSIEIDAVGDVFFTLKDKSEIKISLSADPAEVYANLATLLEADEFSELQPGDFRYIDLRFGNKVFVNREPWPTPGLSIASSTLADDAASSDVRPVTSAVETEVLTVPIIEEANEEVLIEPTPEVIPETGSEEDVVTEPASDSEAVSSSTAENDL